MEIQVVRFRCGGGEPYRPNPPDFLAKCDQRKSIIFLETVSEEQHGLKMSRKYFLMANRNRSAAKWKNPTHRILPRKAFHRNKDLRQTLKWSLKEESES